MLSPELELSLSKEIRGKVLPVGMSVSLNSRRHNFQHLQALVPNQKRYAEENKEILKYRPSVWRGSTMGTANEDKYCKLMPCGSGTRLGAGSTRLKRHNTSNYIEISTSLGSKVRQRPSLVLDGRGTLTNKRTGVIDDTLSSCGSLYRSRKTSRVLSELSKNSKEQTEILQSSQPNADPLEGKTSSSDNVSRLARNSKIPRATSVRKVIPDLFGHGTNYDIANDIKILNRSEGTTIENVVFKKNEISGLSNEDSLEIHSSGSTFRKLRLSDSCNSKRSSDDFDDYLGPISDDDIDISGDVTIRKEALDIAVKLASRTPTEIEESSGLGFPELAMLDILGASDLNLSAPKNELSFTIFEDMDNITDPGSGPSAIDTAGSENNDSAAPEMANPRSPSPIEELPLSSRTPNAPVSIITSITSIMSLDTGYQGDGELSRPESRSAEVDSRLKIPHMENAQAKSINFDDSKTMTDSDFFTESDADIHDDLSAAAAEVGSGKGDRKAQIIDGTLYGGVNIHKHGTCDGDNRSSSRDVNAPSTCSNDEMASSGIFSDVEKKPEEQFLEEAYAPGENSTEVEEGRKLRSETNEGMVKSSSAESSSTIQEMNATMKRTSSNISNQESDRTAQKSNRNSAVINKMPNRNVASKVKVMIESSKTKTETRPKTVRKGKWDAVMDRIAQGKEENKYTPARFRDVKSKVYQATKPLFSKIGDEEDGTKAITNNFQSKTRSRRNVRVRSSESPLVSTKNSRKSGSPNSSQRSSISDISVSAVHKQKLINDSNQNGIPSKSNSSSVTNSASNSNIGNNKYKTKTVKMVQKKSSPLPARPKDVIQQKNGTIRHSEDKTAGFLQQLTHNSKAFESFAVLLRYCINDLEAFSTPHLKERLENEKEKYKQSEMMREETEQLLRDQLRDKIQIINSLEDESRMINEKKEELESLVEDLRAEKGHLKDELSMVQEELVLKTREKEQMEEELKKENQDLIYRIDEANKVHSVLKKLYDKIKLELIAAKENSCKADMIRGQRKEGLPEIETTRNYDLASDRLESEVESLRQVLALKTDEISELRRQELLLRENADRVPKLMSTITLLEGKVEDFQTQLSSQTEANRELEKRNYNLEEEVKLTNVQKLRLTQKNEELQYKLRQYAEALRQLVSHKNLTEDDVRNTYLYPKTPQKGECNVSVDSVTGQMKGVVQKSDSVSYMLEMTEDSNEIVTNIIRRAESLRYASRSQTLPKKKRSKTCSVSSMEALSPFEDYISGERPSSSSTKFPFHKDCEIEIPQTPKNKLVKLQPNDFIPDSIELTAEDHCEIIEITESFDKASKPEELANEMSCSSCSSSTENHFDIESDIYLNASESEKEINSHIEPIFGDRVGEQEVPIFSDDDQKGNFSDFGNVPKTSGGEALSSDFIRSRSISP